MEPENTSTTQDSSSQQNDTSSSSSSSSSSTITDDTYETLESTSDCVTVVERTLTSPSTTQIIDLKRNSCLAGTGAVDNPLRRLNYENGKEVSLSKYVHTHSYMLTHLVVALKALDYVSIRRYTIHNPNWGFSLLEAACHLDLPLVVQCILATDVLDKDDCVAILADPSTKEMPPCVLELLVTRYGLTDDDRQILSDALDYQVGRGAYKNRK